MKLNLVLFSTLKNIENYLLRINLIKIFEFEVLSRQLQHRKLLSKTPYERCTTDNFHSFSSLKVNHSDKLICMNYKETIKRLKCVLI